MYEVYDCLSDTLIEKTPDKTKAGELCAIHGGADNCIHVFEIADEVKPVIEPVKVAEKQPQSGFLF